MNSNNDSEKSVVIDGLHNADPSVLGCGRLESVPFSSTLRLSFSKPRFLSANADTSRGDSSTALS